MKPKRYIKREPRTPMVSVEDCQNCGWAGSCSWCAEYMILYNTDQEWPAIWCYRKRKDVLFYDVSDVFNKLGALDYRNREERFWRDWRKRRKYEHDFQEVSHSEDS